MEGDKGPSEDLTDDAWRLVFCRLPVWDRLRLERVSRRWLHLMPYANIKRLDLGSLPWRPDQVTIFRYEDGHLLNSQPSVRSYWLRTALASLLERTGPYLTSVSFNSEQQRLCLGPETLQLLAEEAPQLQRLDLSHCLLRESCLPIIRSFPRLDYLNLGSTVFLDDGSKLVQDFEPLKQQMEALVRDSAHLSQLNLQQLPFPLLPRLENAALAKLQLSRTPIDDIGLIQVVRDSPRLVSLGISHCRQIQSFQALSSLAATLQRLHLCFTGIQDDEFASICAACKGLEELRLDGTWRLENFVALQHLRNLKHFSITDAPTFSDRALARIARFGQLESFCAAGCAVSDEGARYLSTLCRKALKRLNLANTRLTKHGARCIGENCLFLMELNVQGTKFSDEAVALVGENLRNLEALYLQHCPDVTEAGFTALLKARIRHHYAGRHLAKLYALAKSEGGDSPVSDTTIQRLRIVGVNLVVQRPLLALPGPAE